MKLIFTTILLAFWCLASAQTFVVDKVSGDTAFVTVKTETGQTQSVKLMISESRSQLEQVKKESELKKAELAVLEKRLDLIKTEERFKILESLLAEIAKK